MNITMALRISRQEQGNPRQDEIAIAVSAPAEDAERLTKAVDAMEQALWEVRKTLISASHSEVLG